MDNAQRLQAFEEVLEQALAERADINARMEDLCRNGKAKSVSYQQYFSMRHELDAMLERFRERGLIE